MLTDIFLNRYSQVTIWEPPFSETERRLLVQSFRILSEQVCPYYVNGNPTEHSKSFWTDLHSLISMELGLKSLGPLGFVSQTGHYYTHSMHTVCENWMLQPFDGTVAADNFVKERLSLVEIGFRKREEQIAEANAKLPETISDPGLSIGRKSAIRLPGDFTQALIALNKKSNDNFRASVEELNARFRQAGCNLHYHNGFIQRSTDALSVQEVEAPFWALVADAKWKNVDTDMKEALDRRDNDDRDPAWYAARALESTIKIISAEKNWTTGNEKGAHNYIDNLKRGLFAVDWEVDALKAFFTKVRNPLGHGPGKDDMPSLTNQQTDWTIGLCMAWIKSLIRRM